MSDMENKAIFSANLRRYMELNNKSRADICNDLGFKYTTFTDWVNGNKYPRIDKIEMLAKYFGIEKSDLIERKAPSSTDEDDMSSYLEELRSNPDLRMLFQTGRNMTPDQLRSVVQMLKGFNK